MDKRWQALADILVNYSTQVRPNEKVMIAMGELDSYPLMHSIYGACLKAGACPQVQFLSEELNRLLMKQGTQAQIESLPGIEAYGMEWADVYFGLRGAHNLDVFWDIPTDRLANFRQTLGKVSTLRWEKTRSCLLRVPNAALASQAGVDEETIKDEFFEGSLLDWSSLGKMWQRSAEILGKGSRIRVVGKETDISFSVSGRPWMVADGKLNMPDGEIATSPVESTVDGKIYFELPGVLGGRLMENIRLTWEKGKLKEAYSTTNRDFLQSIVDTDAGASLLGEFAFGTNPVIKHFCKDILIDEKIGGTIHVALGRAYPPTGGTNKSAIHWDIIKDMREEGKVFLDDVIIFENGQLLV